MTITRRTARGPAADPADPDGPEEAPAVLDGKDAEEDEAAADEAAVGDAEEDDAEEDEGEEDGVDMGYSLSGVPA